MPNTKCAYCDIEHPATMGCAEALGKTLKTEGPNQMFYLLTPRGAYKIGCDCSLCKAVIDIQKAESAAQE